MSDILSINGHKIAQNEDGLYIITNGVIDKSLPVVNEAHFEQNEKTIIEALDKAKVSINVAMAWFTNDKIKDKLIEMKNAGVDVDLIIYDDITNKKHGVDLSELPHLFVKGSRGGIMHNKFCVIDNQIVIQGSYNWTNKAEAKNDETIAILKDPKTATDFSVKFQEIKKNSKKQLN
jgi:phosphatidylserine/phosphatidylglycerophosphate/cardiolipin synthase-like enzyme